MVLALSAVQRGKRGKFLFFLAATVLIGSCFLGVQVYEYYQLMVGHHYPPGISATDAFPPERQPVRLLLLHDDRVPRGARHRRRDHAALRLHPVAAAADSRRPITAPVEMAGLYWHFVDLVWIILFTIVYLI